MTNIVVNGENTAIPDGLSLVEVLAFLGVQDDRVAVEKDRAIVRKPDWARTKIESGSHLEIVQFVGGG